MVVNYFGANVKNEHHKRHFDAERVVSGITWFKIGGWSSLGSILVLWVTHFLDYTNICTKLAQAIML
jgi:hypothetical protein